MANAYLSNLSYSLVRRVVYYFLFVFNYFHLQVYPDGVRHIRSDKRLQDWKVPSKKQIVKCAVNQRQVVIALTGGELVYFEMDPVSTLNDNIFSNYLKLQFNY